MDLTSWLEFFTQGLATQLDEVKARGESVIRCDVVSKSHQLNQRQSRILETLIFQSSVTIREVEAMFEGVSRRTLQRDFSVMIDKGLVQSMGETNNLNYSLTSKTM